MSEWTYPDQRIAVPEVSDRAGRLALDDPIAEAFYLRVSELRQYWYCPRLLYYFYCMPDIRPTTYKMEEGVEQHLEEVEREKRRGLGFYGMAEVEDRARKQFALTVQSDSLRIRGRLDALIEVQDQGIVLGYPVEYKATKREPGAQYKLQLAAYALLLEEAGGHVVRQGFFVLTPLRKVIPVRLDAGAKARARSAIAAMHAVVASEAVPPPPKSVAKCTVCEFRRFCNDVQ